MNSHLKNMSHNTIVILLTVLSCFVISLQASFSPFSNHFPIQDQAAFIVIGKAINNGYIPFLDIVDVKGIIFFFFEALCYKIGGQTFIWIVDIILMSISTLLILRICDLICKKTNKIFILFFTVALLSTYNYRVNTIEIFALPFILFGSEIIIKTIVNKQICQNITLILSFLCLFILIHIKMNFAMPLIILNLIYICSLFKNCQYIALYKYFGLAIFSFVLVNMPLLIYLYIYGALYNYLEYYFLYGIQYSSVVPFVSKLNNFIILFSNFGCFLSAFFIILSIFYHTNTKKQHIYWIFVLLFIMTTLFSVGLSGYHFEHYLIIIIPFFSIFTSILLGSINSQKYLLLCYIFSSSMIMFYTTYCFKNIKTIISKNYDKYEISLLNISHHIQKESNPHEKIAIYAIDPSIYILSNHNPGLYAYAYAEMIILAKESEEKKYISYLLKNRIKLFITNNDKCIFKDSINKKYKIIYSDSLNNVIYKLKK